MKVTLIAVLTWRAYLVRIPFDLRRAERADHPSVGHAGSALRPGATASARDDSAFRDSAVPGRGARDRSRSADRRPRGRPDGPGAQSSCRADGPSVFWPAEVSGPAVSDDLASRTCGTVAVIAVFVGVLFWQGQRSA